MKLDSAVVTSILIIIVLVCSHVFTKQVQRNNAVDYIAQYECRNTSEYDHLDCVNGANIFFEGESSSFIIDMADRIKKHLGE